MDGIEQSIMALFNGTAETPLDYATGIVAILIVIVAIVSLFVSLVLSIKYARFNRRPNNAGLTGVETARTILDNNGLSDIKVSVVGSLLFGNSYSHYFKKVRLRRLTRNKTSISAMAMGAQKSCLAILDKEQDPDMKRRIRLVPIINFGPFMFVPLIVVGVILDILVFQSETIGTCTVIAAILGLAFLVLSLLLSIATLKTEKKAQERACKVLKNEKLATGEEIDMMKDLFKLYNIEYINDIILSSLELLYYVLQILGKVQGSSSSKK